MSNAENEDQRFVIETGGRVVGLVVQEKDGFRFYAAKRRYADMEGMLYRSAGHAEDACRKIDLDYRRRAIKRKQARERRDVLSEVQLPVIFVPVAGTPFAWPFDHL